MKSKLLFVVATTVAVGAALPFAHAIWPSGGSSAVFGPVSCSECRGQIRVPDSATRAFLMRYTQVTNQNNRGTFKESIQPGSKVIVCNASNCVTYQMTDSFDWNGTSSEPIPGPAPATGSNGSGIGQGGGSRGGAPVGGGCHGNCGGGGGSGTVTVGPLNPPKPKRPTHEN